jgi:uncharacterized membrane protein YcaP (DUF421 family)
MNGEGIGEILTLVFGGDTPMRPLASGQIAARAVLVYVVGLTLVRIGKSRLISRASPIDVILGFILGSLLSRGITGNASISETLVASAVLIGIHWSFTAIGCRCEWFDTLIKGHSKPLVVDGEIRWEALRESHISKEDLMGELRLNANLDDLSRVRVAYKERSGEVGVIKTE